MRAKLRGTLFVLALTTAWSAATAQGPNVLTGRITSRGASMPVTDAVITIVGTSRGARSDAEGRYRIVNVDAGTFTVRVTRLGYAASSRQITLGAGQTNADFELAEAAVTIDEVLITATGQSERKRENGNDVGIIKPGSDVSIAATPTLTNVLAARTAGLTVTQNMGTPGTGSRIRIRGSNSVSLSNEPLLIVDGVRINNDVSATSLGVGGATTSRFDDINPEEIENIEVLKGPAASALYGTAAANGVIQITTKRGRSGKTTWHTFGQTGALRDLTEYPTNYYVIGHTSTGTPFKGSCTIDRRTQGLCTADSTFRFNPLEHYDVQGTGHQFSTGLSSAGGGDAAQYFVAGEFGRTQGLVEPSKVRDISVRANISAQMRKNLSTVVTANYIDRSVRLPYNDNNIYGVVPNGILGKGANCVAGAVGGTAYICGTDTLSRGFYSVLPSTFYYVTNQQLVKRFVGGINTTWQATSWLTGFGQLGLDGDNSLDEVLQPANVVTFINQGLIDGYRRQRRLQNLNYSANGSLSANTAVPTVNALLSTFTVGAQYLNEQRHFTDAQGRSLVPGTGSLATAGAGKDVNENNQTIVTVGGYVREQLAWRDRLFVTGAIRADDNSAFGSNFNLAKYPAASASWVISEEPFFRDHTPLDFLDQLRLRYAYGKSGQRPGFRQSDTYLSGVSVADKGSAELTAVIIGGTGNANLRPEISTENEFGFDVNFLQNRLGLTYTHYRKVTNDALIARVLAPSLGVSTTKFDNLGQVLNSGNEATASLTIVNVPSAKLELNVAGSTNRNRLTDLGGVPPITFNGARQQHTEGYPLGGFFQPHYTYSDANGDGLISRTEITVNSDTALASRYVGPSLPTRELSLSPSLSILNGLRLSALFNYRGGNYMYNQSEEFRCTTSAFVNCAAVNDPSAPLAQQARAIARTAYATSYGYLEKADFWKLREVAVSYTVPSRLIASRGLSGLTLTVAGRNLKTWTDYTGFDPEVNQSTGNFTNVDFLTQPPVRTITARLELTF